MNRSYVLLAAVAIFMLLAARLLTQQGKVVQVPLRQVIPHACGALAHEVKATRSGYLLTVYCSDGSVRLGSTR